MDTAAQDGLVGELALQRLKEQLGTQRASNCTHQQTWKSSWGWRSGWGDRHSSSAIRNGWSHWNFGSDHCLGQTVDLHPMPSGHVAIDILQFGQNLYKWFRFSSRSSRSSIQWERLPFGFWLTKWLCHADTLQISRAPRSISTCRIAWHSFAVPSTVSRATRIWWAEAGRRVVTILDARLFLGAWWWTKWPSSLGWTRGIGALLAASGLPLGNTVSNAIRAIGSGYPHRQKAASHEVQGCTGSRSPSACASSARLSTWSNQFAAWIVCWDCHSLWKIAKELVPSTTKKRPAIPVPMLPSPMTSALASDRYEREIQVRISSELKAEYAATMQKMAEDQRHEMAQMQAFGQHESQEMRRLRHYLQRTAEDSEMVGIMMNEYAEMALGKQEFLEHKGYHTGAPGVKKSRLKVLHPRRQGSWCHFSLKVCTYSDHFKSASLHPSCSEQGLQRHDRRPEVSLHSIFSFASTRREALSQVMRWKYARIGRRTVGGDCAGMLWLVRCTQTPASNSCFLPQEWPRLYSKRFGSLHFPSSWSSSLHGMIAVEIDDLLMFGDEVHEEKVEALQQRFSFGKLQSLDEKGVNFNGRRLRKIGSTVEVDMKAFVEERLANMRLAELGRQRRTARCSSSGVVVFFNDERHEDRRRHRAEQNSGKAERHLQSLRWRPRQSQRNVSAGVWSQLHHGRMREEERPKGVTCLSPTTRICWRGNEPFAICYIGRAESSAALSIVRWQLKYSHWQGE